MDICEIKRERNLPIWVFFFSKEYMLTYLGALFLQWKASFFFPCFRPLGENWVGGSLFKTTPCFKEARNSKRFS